MSANEKFPVTHEPLSLEWDAVERLPPASLEFLGRLMAWSAYIEYDLFCLYAIAKGGDLVECRRKFFRNTRGMFLRVQQVEKAFAGRLRGGLASAFANIMRDAKALCEHRNDWAHNPLFLFGPDARLSMLKVASGDFAGDLVFVDQHRETALLPLLKKLHGQLITLIGLLGNPAGGKVFFVFGPTDAATMEQIRTLASEPAAARNPK
jgi:hypothetical protein